MSPKAALARWRDDPVLFTREVLGLDPWPRQAELLASVADHDRVACRSGHKVGKSTADAIIALWWVCTRPRARVVFTAPAGHQVQDILWPELRRLYREARAPIGGKLFEDYHHGLKFSDGREVFGLTTRDAEAFAGISSPALLFLVDEASGFPESIFDAVFGNVAGGGRVVLTGNPTRTSGTFFDAFHAKRAGWHCLHISSLESPNFHGQSIPGLATPSWLDTARTQWGEDTPAWDVRVLGDFPRAGENVVVPLSLCEAARARWPETDGIGRLHIGVDVARFGDDDSVIAPRRGKRVSPLVALHSMDGPTVAGHVLALARDLRVDGERPLVKVDVIGVGAAVFDVLSRSSEVEAIAVNVASRAQDEERFVNLRTELGFALRSFLQDGGALPDDPLLEGEIASGLYQFDARGRYQIESKDKVKARLHRSPDRKDAVELSLYAPPETDFAGWSESFASIGRRDTRASLFDRIDDTDDTFARRE